jgi:hypothetical protein
MSTPDQEPASFVNPLEQLVDSSLAREANEASGISLSLTMPPAPLPESKDPSIQALMDKLTETMNRKFKELTSKLTYGLEELHEKSKSIEEKFDLFDESLTSHAQTIRDMSKAMNKANIKTGKLLAQKTELQTKVEALESTQAIFSETIKRADLILAKADKTRELKSQAMKRRHSEAAEKGEPKPKKCNKPKGHDSRSSSSSSKDADKDKDSIESFSDKDDEDEDDE